MDNTAYHTADLIAQGALKRLNIDAINPHEPNGVMILALSYVQYARGAAWVKYEAIKSGDFAGTLIDIPVQAPLTLASFRLYAGISMKRWREMEKDEAYDDVTDFIRTVTDSNMTEGAILGLYNASYVAKVQGLTDKKEIGGVDGGPILIEQITGMEIL